MRSKGDLATSDGKRPMTLPLGAEHGSVLSVCDTSPTGLRWCGNVQCGVILQDFPAGTAGGSATAGSWNIRAFNSKVGNADYLALDGDNFTLTKGSYLVQGHAPANQVGRHQARIYRVSAPAGDEMHGSVSVASLDTDHVTLSMLRGVIEVDDPIATFRLEHRSEMTKTTDGWGIPSPWGEAEVYAAIAIQKNC